MRASRRSSGRVPGRSVADVSRVDRARADVERRVSAELETWRARAIPDVTAPLEAEDLVSLLRDCVAALGLDGAIAADFTVNTVHYYRRKDIIDPPEGRTAAARYELRHLWQIAGARLAGHLGLVTLADARTAIRGVETPALVAFLAARVADARARDVVRDTSRATMSAAPAESVARPLPGVVPSTASPGIPATMIPLTDDAWCVIPAAHAAHRSPDAARALVQALATALDVNANTLR
jgi:hypothetical protein